MDKARTVANYPETEWGMKQIDKGAWLAAIGVVLFGVCMVMSMIGVFA